MVNAARRCLVIAVLLPTLVVGASGLCAVLDLCELPGSESPRLARGGEGACHEAAREAMAADGPQLFAGPAASDGCCWQLGERLEAKIERRQSESLAHAAVVPAVGDAFSRLALRRFEGLGEVPIFPLRRPAFTLHASLLL